MSSIDSSPSLISSPPSFHSMPGHQIPSPNKLFVGGISWRADEAGLTKFFSAFGKVLDCKIIMDKITLKSKGYGFITFENEESVTKVKNEAALSFLGKNMNVGDAMRKSDGFVANNGAPFQQSMNGNAGHQHQQVQQYSLVNVNGNMVADDGYSVALIDGAYDTGAALNNGYTQQPAYYVYYDMTGAVVYQQAPPYPYYQPYGLQPASHSMTYNPPMHQNQNWRPYYQQLHYPPSPTSPNGNRQSPSRNSKSTSHSPNHSPNISNNTNHHKNNNITNHIDYITENNITHNSNHHNDKSES